MFCSNFRQDFQILIQKTIHSLGDIPSLGISVCSSSALSSQVSPITEILQQLSAMLLDFRLREWNFKYGPCLCLIPRPV